MTDPILHAEQLLREAVTAMAGPGLVAAGYVDADDVARLYWRLDASGQAQRPFVVFFPQTDLDALQYVGLQGVSTQLTLRATADDPDDALAALNAAASGLGATTVAGYRISATWRRSPTLPRTPSGAWQSAHIYDLTILPTGD